MKVMINAYRQDFAFQISLSYHVEHILNKKSTLFFWIVTACRFEGRYQRFGGTYCLYLQGLRTKLACSLP
jgi:hypothetical protein